MRPDPAAVHTGDVSSTDIRLSRLSHCRSPKIDGMQLLADLLDLALPASCVCCGRSGPNWCTGCQPASVTTPVALAHGPPTFAAGEYAAELRTVLLSYKERGQRQLAGYLAGYLADATDFATRTVGAGALPVLVPVPSRRSAARARGGDHVLRLARAVSRQSDRPVVRLLRLTGPVADSAGLNPAQRRANLSGRMAAAPPRELSSPLCRQVILLDDIVTTGATLAESARALTVAGWTPLAAAVVAATRLRATPAHGDRVSAERGVPAQGRRQPVGSPTKPKQDRP